MDFTPSPNLGKKQVPIMQKNRFDTTCFPLTAGVRAAQQAQPLTPLTCPACGHLWEHTAAAAEIQDERQAAAQGHSQHLPAHLGPRQLGFVGPEPPALPKSPAASLVLLRSGSPCPFSEAAPRS